MVQFIPEYEKYSRILGIYTLAIRIRQRSWWIRELLKNIAPNIKKLKKKIKKIKKINFYADIADISKTSSLLASELRRWMHLLKVIYFHNSAILHLQLKILLRVYGEIYKKKKQIESMRRKEKERIKLKLLSHKLNQLRREIKYIHKTDECIIHSLYSYKKGFNKSLRHSSSIKTLTFLPSKRITQKIRIKARKMKEIEEKRKKLMSKFSIENEANLRKLAALLKKEIKSADKDVLFARQLIKKLENKNEHIEIMISHNLKHKMKKMRYNKDVIDRTLQYTQKPFKDMEISIHSDLEKMFYNALRQLNMSARKSRRIQA